MIIHASMRTDIPALYSEWFTNRIREGYVRVRNPYDPLQVTEYSLDPEVVDLIVFCSKNPVPMLKYMDLLTSYRTYWYITITPYEADILIHGHTHVLRAENMGNYILLNPGSVSIPKEGNPPTYAVYEDGIFTIKDFEGNTVREITL